MFMTCAHAFYTVWIAAALGWVVAYLPSHYPIKVRPYWPRLALYCFFQTVLTYLAITFIPGWKHPIFIMVIAGALLITPWFMLHIGAFESVRDGKLGKLFTKLLNILFTISLIALMDLWARSYQLYSFTLLMQLFIAASLYLTGTPALLHRQQRIVMRPRDWNQAASEYLNG